MINGTTDLDTALKSLELVLKTVREEQWSVDYTHTNAPLTGRMLSEKMPVNELLDFSEVLRESTKESKENIDKTLTLINMMSEILGHYTKLAEIGCVWEDNN